MRSILLALLAGLVAGPVLADSVWVGSLERQDVKVRNFRNGVVEFTIEGRAVDPVPAERVARLLIEDEPTFSKAEQAFAEGNFAAATEGYLAASKSTSKPWLQDWMLPKLLTAADRSGRFDVPRPGLALD